MSIALYDQCNVIEMKYDNSIKAKINDRFNITKIQTYANYIRGLLHKFNHL